MRKLIFALAPLATLVLTGCPQSSGDGNSPVTAKISVSATHGSAPLSVAVSAAESASTNGGTLQYAWDFDDGTTSADVALTHIYANPGRYALTLRVTDETGAQDTASQEIRVAGSGAVAVIAANIRTGTAPLAVQFDGTQSIVPDDTVLDYYWNFDDGGQSRLPKPLHVFTRDGEFTVTLRIVTAGGVEAQTSTQIAVGQRNASLQFDGGSFATLPFGRSVTADAVTLEAWVKADTEGGTVATLGAGVLGFEVVPAENALRLRVGATTTNVTATNLVGIWKHIAVVYSATDGVAVLYLNGVPLPSLAVSGPITANGITIGAGMRGKIADVRFWGVARNAVDLAATMNRRLSGTETGLIGYWPIDEGSGQVLNNLVSGGADGTLGASTIVETADPAWSTDGPPF